MKLSLRNFIQKTMKIIKHLFILPILILALVGCKDDDELSVPTLTAENDFSVFLPYDIKKTQNLTFTASDDWSITPERDHRYSLSATSGKAGKNTITVRASSYNCTNDDAHYTFTITSTNARGTANVYVDVAHEPVYRIDSLNYEAAPEGDVVRVVLRTKHSKSLYVLYDHTFEGMWDTSVPTSGTKAQAKDLDSKMQLVKPIATRADSSGYVIEYYFGIKPNTTSDFRTGCFWFSDGNTAKVYSDMITVVQPPANIYRSKDMTTEDGKVTQLQKHKLGNGVPIVILGDGFVDRDITNGKFREATNKAVDGIFSLQPMKALRDYFDVYEVTAVSYNDYFTARSSTAFSSQFASYSTTEISGDDTKAMEYAKKAIGEKRLNNAQIIVLINENRYAGTCYMYTDGKKSDIANGCSVAYVPLWESNYDDMSFVDVLCHEAIGHGFAKLGDEYTDDDNPGTIPNDEKQETIKMQECGFYRNIVFDSDVKKSYWADFAADSRYKSENLGCYEGGATYAHGVYRPTDNSIMNDNINGFNVAGRVMIYKRCMKIALGDSWKFNLADFIAFDLEEGKATASTKRKAAAKRSATFLPLAKPKVIVKK
jgi:hypothetical protein